MVLSLDIGGTHIRIAEISKNKINKKRVINTPKRKEEILNALYDLINKYPDKKTICISLAGLVKDGKIIKTPNLNLYDTDLKKILTKKYNSNVFIENDSKCAAMAENKYGYGKKYSNFIYLTIGTGIGGAVFIRGKLYVGNGHAGEFGHMTIGGEEYEKIASGSALTKLANELNLNLIGEQLCSLAQNGHPLAIKIFDIIVNNLSEGLMNIIYAYDPQAIIIGGSFSNISFLPSKLTNSLRKLDIIERKLDIINALLGEDAQLIGAALQAKKSFQ